MFFTKDVAARLGVTERRVLALAKSRGLGKKTNRDWIFTQTDINKMETRVNGRPKKRS